MNTNETMQQDKDKPRMVWLSYRSKGDNTIHRVEVLGKVANRWLKKLVPSKAFVWDIVEPVHESQRLRRVPMSSRLDYLLVEGSYTAEVKKRATTEARIHLQVSQSNNFKKKQLEVLQEQEEQEIISSRVAKTGKITTQRMSFHIGRLEQSVIVLCPITGIVGKLDMPYCPVALTYEHPLAKPGNVLSLLRYHYSLVGQQQDVLYLKHHSQLKLDRQTLAGCLLSLLKGKFLLQEEQETTATERNMVLQNAGYNILNDVLKEIVRVWDNPQVWKKMPRLSVEWKSHASTDSTIGGTLQQYLKTLKNTLDPISSLSNEEQAKIFQAQSVTKAKGIKVYSATVVEHRKIKEGKTEAYDLFDKIKDQFTIIQRAQVNRTIKDLMLLPASERAKTASLIRGQMIGKFQATVARDLADLIEGISNTALLNDLSRLSDDSDTARGIAKRDIADILAAKRAKREDKDNG